MQADEFESNSEEGYTLYSYSSNNNESKIIHISPWLVSAAVVLILISITLGTVMILTSNEKTSQSAAQVPTPTSNPNNLNSFKQNFSNTFTPPGQVAGAQKKQLQTQNKDYGPQIPKPTLTPTPTPTITPTPTPSPTPSPTPTVQPTSAPDTSPTDTPTPTPSEIPS